MTNTNTAAKDKKYNIFYDGVVYNDIPTDLTAYELEQLMQERKRKNRQNTTSTLDVTAVQCNISNDSLHGDTYRSIKSRKPTGIPNWVRKSRTATVATQTLESGENWYYAKLEPNTQCCLSQNTAEPLHCCYNIVMDPNEMKRFNTLPRQYFQNSDMNDKSNKPGRNEKRDEIQKESVYNPTSRTAQLPSSAKRIDTIEQPKVGEETANKTLKFNESELKGQRPEKYGQRLPQTHNFDIDDIRTRDLYGTNIANLNLPQREHKPKEEIMAPKPNAGGPNHVNLPVTVDTQRQTKSSENDDVKSKTLDENLEMSLDGNKQRSRFSRNSIKNPSAFSRQSSTRVSVSASSQNKKNRTRDSVMQLLDSLDNTESDSSTEFTMASYKEDRLGQKSGDIEKTHSKSNAEKSNATIAPQSQTSDLPQVGRIDSQEYLRQLFSDIDKNKKSEEKNVNQK